MSTELCNAFMEDTRQIMVRIEINGRVFDNDDITSLNLEYGSMDGGSLSLGATVASSLQLTFSRLVEGLQELSEIVVEMGAVLPDGTTEYVPMGTFIVNDEIIMDRNNNKTTVEAMDKMIMLGGIYEPSLTGNYAPIREVALDIANQAGVEVESNFDRLRSDSILIPRGKTYREAIGIIAQFEVGFATFSRLGKLEIKRLKNTDFRITPDDYTMKGLVKNEVLFRLNGIQCQVGDNEDDILQLGSSIGNQIVLNNPSMTQTHLNRLFEELKTLNYYPYTLDWHGNPALEAGDWIEIEDLEGNLFKSPNLNYTIEFNGGLKAKSQAETTATSEVVYQYKSPLKQQIEWINARISASGGNHIYDDITEPNNPKEGDLWFKPVGPEKELWQFSGGAWVKIISTADMTKVQREVEKALSEAEEAKQAAEQSYSSSVAEAERLVEEQSEAFDAQMSDVNSEINMVKSNVNTAISNVNQEIADNFTSLSDTISEVDDLATQAKADADQALLDLKSKASTADLLKKADTTFVNAELAKKLATSTYNTKMNALDTAISGHTTRIEATETGLLAKASTTDVNALKTRMSNAETSLTTNANAIALKASQEDLDTVEGRLETAEAELVVQAGEIASKVAKTDFNKLSGRVGTAESTITQHASEIASRVKQTDFDSLSGRVETAESSITQQAGQISLKASQSDLDAIDGRMDSAESELSVQAGLIASKVSQSEFDAVENRLDSAESTITQQASQIALRVTKTELTTTIDGIEIGTRNLLRDSNIEFSFGEYDNKYIWDVYRDNTWEVLGD